MCCVGDKLKKVRRSGFTTLPNAVVQDARLNFAAKGLFWLMFSLPDDWDFSISGLASYAGGARGNGKDAIRAALATLEEAGYLLREQRHDENGHFAGNCYVLYDESASPLSGFPTTEKPTTEKPSSENPTEQNKDKQIIPPKAPRGGRGGGKLKRRTKSKRRTEPKPAPDWKPERFAGLWELYPHEKRGNKQNAIAAWEKLHPSDELIAELGKCFRLLMNSKEWQAGIGIPHLSTWLNPATERWRDAYNLVDERPAPRRAAEEGFVWR